MTCGCATGARRRQDRGPAAATDVGNPDAHAAGELRRQREKALQLGLGRSVEDDDLRAATGAGTDDDVGLAVAVHVAGRQEQATGEGRREGIEGGQQAEALAVEDGDLGAAAGSGGGDDVGEAVAVDVAGGDADAAGEGGRGGVEAGDLAAVLAAGDRDLRSATRSARR